MFGWMRKNQDTTAKSAKKELLETAARQIDVLFGVANETQRDELAALLNVVIELMRRERELSPPEPNRDWVQQSIDELKMLVARHT